MTEEEAVAWVHERWGAVAIERLQHYAELVLAESASQNLIAPSTIGSFWSRHIVDSAQLISLAQGHAVGGAWVDVGSGAGLPGIVAAILQSREVILIEPRRRRAAFLETVASALALPCRVVAAKVERLAQVPAAIISARAVAALDELLFLARPVSSPETLWLLPRGRSAHSEVAAASQAWHGRFHVEQSVTASDSMIVIAQGIRTR